MNSLNGEELCIKQCILDENKVPAQCCSFMTVMEKSKLFSDYFQ